MDRPVLLGKWMGRLTYFAIAMTILFVDLLPLSFTPSFMPTPDLLFVLTLAIALRRPEFVPDWLVALIFFLADILLMRPPGLWTVAALVATIFTSRQEYRFRDAAFLLEWGFVASVMFLAMLANRMALTIMLVDQPPFGTMMLHFLVTAAIYPLVVAFCYFILRIRKVTPDVAIRFGHRL